MSKCLEENTPAQSNLTCSFEKSVEAANTTLKQLATAKETFSDFGASYKQFLVELNEIREDHRLELYRCQKKIDDLLKQKSALEEQLYNSRKQAKKYKEELVVSKIKQAETEWENEKQGRELSSSKATIERLKAEKNTFEQEMTSLRGKVTRTNQRTSLTAAIEEENCTSMLDIAKQEAEQLESRYRLTMEEKDSLHMDIVSLQKRMTDLQTEYKKTEKELQTQTQNANVKAYKADMQLKNITRQKEALKSQLEECQNEVKKSKNRCVTLERQRFECQQVADAYKDEITVKSRQLETLNELNKTLENKMDIMSNELCTPEVSDEMLTSQDESRYKDLQLSDSKVKDLETSLQSTRNEKQDLEHDIFLANNKITDLQESNRRSQEKIRELERQVRLAHDSASALETELFTQGGQYSQLQGELNQLRPQVHDLESKLNDANQRNSEMERRFEQVLEEKDELKDNISLADKKVAEMIEIVQRDEDTKNQLEERISSIRNKLSKLEGQTESSLKQMMKLKLELEAEKTKKEKVQKEMFAARCRLDESQRSIERLKRESGFKETFSDDLKKTTKLKSREEKIQKLNEQLGKLQAKLEVVEEEKRDLHEEALHSRNSIKELEADNNLCVQEKDRLDLEIQELCKKSNDLQSNLNVCEHEKREFEHQVTLLQQKARKYEAELAEIMKNSADLEAKIQEAISSTCKSNLQITVLRRQVEEYKHTADEIRQEVTKKDMQVEQLREKIMVHTAYSESIQDELDDTKSLLETRDKEKTKLDEQFVVTTEELNRVQVMQNITTKRKEQLEDEVEMLRNKLLAVEENAKKNRDVNLVKELEYERAEAQENQRKVSSFESKIDSLQPEADISRKDVHVVTQDLQLAERTISNLSCNLEKSLEVRNEEAWRLYLLENKLRDMEKDLDLSQTSKHKAEEKVFPANMMIAKLKSTIDGLDKTRNLIEEHLDAANDSLMNKKEEIMILHSKIIEQNNTNEYLNHLSKKNHVIQESRDRMKICEADLESLSKLENTVGEMRTMINRVALLELQLEKANKSKENLEKQQEQHELKFSSLVDDVRRARLKIEKAHRDFQQNDGEKCSVNEVIACSEQIETYSSPSLQNTDKPLNEVAASTDATSELHHGTDGQELHHGTDGQELHHGTVEQELHHGTDRRELHHDGTDEQELHHGTVEQELHHGTDGQELHHGTDGQELHHRTDGQELHHGTDGQELHHGTDGQELHHGTDGKEMHHGTDGQELHHGTDGQVYDVTSKEDDVTSTEDEVTSKEHDVTSKEDDVTSKEDDVTSKEDDVTSKEDDVTSKEDDVTSKEDDVPSSHETENKHQILILENRKMAEVNKTLGKEVQETKEIINDFEKQQLRLQGEVDAIVNKLSTNQNDTNTTKESNSPRQDEEVSKLKENLPNELDVEYELSSAKEKIKEPEAQLQRGLPTTHEVEKVSELENGDRLMEKEKSNAEEQFDEHVKNKKRGADKEIILDLQEENRDLKTQTKQYKNYNEKMNVMICTLRMQIAKLQKELVKYSRENLFDFKTRYTAENKKKDFNNNESPSALFYTPARNVRAAAPLFYNDKSVGLRAISTPNPGHRVEFDRDILPEISSLNLTEDVVIGDITEKVETASQSTPINKNKTLRLNKEENTTDEVDVIVKEDKVVLQNYHAKDENTKNKCEEEQTNAVEMRENADEVLNEEAHEEETNVTKTDETDCIENVNCTLEDKEAKNERIGNDIVNIVGSIAKDPHDSDSKGPLNEQQVRSCDQQMYRLSVGTNILRSSSSMTSNSDRPYTPAYSTHRAPGRNSIYASKSASRTFTRKYC